MGIKILNPVKDLETRYVSEERLYLTNEGEIVREGDPRSAFLLVGAGGTIDYRMVIKLGEKLTDYIEMVEKEKDLKTKALKEQANKEIKSAPKNKEMKPEQDK